LPKGKDAKLRVYDPPQADYDSLAADSISIPFGAQGCFPDEEEAVFSFIIVA
jgi:hypothetical protein